MWNGSICQKWVNRWHGLRNVGVCLVDAFRQCKQICSFLCIVTQQIDFVCNIVFFFFLKGCCHYSGRFLLIASLLSLIFQMHVLSVNLLITEKYVLVVVSSSEPCAALNLPFMEFMVFSVFALFRCFLCCEYWLTRIRLSLHYEKHWFHFSKIPALGKC